MQALQVEVAPFGIQTAIFNPRFFRTELLTGQSTNYADNPIADYDERREQQMLFGKVQTVAIGRPAKIGKGTDNNSK